ncbi:NHL repeat-containing protein [Janthinobacterium fluminis]|uniref:NHL repeat-containing protein n=1 Tax=Janthinobacterium fluminis TaxID=2987524 RepID=A0ABT5JWR0_9BURK|nr:NHL repeat-containing protein [Janthinobacterium fluminis]MDC8757175.1 NHL repeat-containing protein [Janthinobacterium fluminis]
MNLPSIFNRLWRAGLLSGLALASTAQATQTFADEDRSAELASQPPHQRYQFNSPTTVTYDKSSIGAGAAGARVYVADMGNDRVVVLNLNGQKIGVLDAADTLRAADSPAAAVAPIKAPLGIAFLSASEALDPRLAGLYVNDVGSHQIHFFRPDAADADKFYYVTSFGVKGSGGGLELNVPRNMVVTPQGWVYVSDEFNNRIKGFRLNPDAAYAVTYLNTSGAVDAGGHAIPAGPVIPGVDKDYGSDSGNYSSYAGQPNKVAGFRIPQGMTYWRSPAGNHTYLYVCDNGNNRIKIFEVNQGSGAITLVDIIGRYTANGTAGHLKRPRGVRTDKAGNLYVADSYNGQILKFANLDGALGTVSYRAGGASDASAAWTYGRLGIQQIELRAPVTAATEDAAFQLPNDAVPIENPDGTPYRESIWASGVFYSNLPVLLVSDPGNHRIKKCWAASSGGSIVRCSVSAGVGGTASNEFWGYPRTLTGQVHAISAMTYLQGSSRLLVSDTPNTRINMYSASGAYLGKFGGGDINYGVTGISAFPVSAGEEVAVVTAADTSLPFPYTGDSSLRIYKADGTLRYTFNLGYRTTGLAAPKIAFANANFPVGLHVKAEAPADQFSVYLTSFGNYAWKFSYNRAAGTLSYAWAAGGADASKGTDVGTSWALGPNFYNQGAAGTFDTIQGILALNNRVYAVDRRNQRIQALNPANGALLGQIGQGGGTYDHNGNIVADEFFLPEGLGYDSTRQRLLVGDGFNMVAKSFANPDLVAPNASGKILPAFNGYWLNPALGTRPGGLFATQQAVAGGGKVYVSSLISCRVTIFDWSELTPP